jgi:hypothetical protein
MFSSFVVESGLQIELIRLVVSFHLGHEGLHHVHLHVQQICGCLIDAFRDGELRHLLNVCGSVFTVLKAVIVFDVVFGIVDVVEVESDVIFVGCHLSRVARLDSEGVVCVETSSLDLEFLVCLGIRCLNL